ncbi:hypothetical protein [Streptomyces sp. NPDC093984]|uniref:hypothetical protein n=1 Tax=Streptomyces sp. NPDC093984 TaxID=3366052 RepID=UPI0037F2A4BE
MKLFRSRGRNDDGQTTRPTLAQALALYKAGRYAEAETVARAVALARSFPREDAPQALSIAAAAMGAQGRYGEALATYDELLPVFGRLFGAKEWRTLKLRSDRAQTLTALGRHSECEAECVALTSVAARGRVLQMRMVAAAARNGLIYALNGQGRHQEAEALAREALAAHRLPGRFAFVLRLGLARSLNGQSSP